ncbi:MAG: DUF2905 domain-containing protein [Bacteroidia bacterium]
MPNLGKYLVVAGALIMLTGVIIWLLGNKLQWFGNLPGDVRFERENFKFYAPFMSMFLVSIFLSFLIWIIKRLFY